jgi:peptidoglycan DL-endopeptidase CwlO
VLQADLGVILQACRRGRFAAAAPALFLVAGVLTAAQPQQPESARADPQQQVATAVQDDALDARKLDAARADRYRRETQPAPAVAQEVAKPAEPKPAQPKAQPTRTAAPAKPAPRTEFAPGAPAAGRLAVVVNFALAQVGKPYGFGQAGPRAYDCSGLVMASFAQIGLSLPHQSEQIPARGRYVPPSQWQAGTVLHWPGHVAIYLGGGKMVHASRAGVPVGVASVYGSPTGYNMV